MKLFKQRFYRKFSKVGLPPGTLVHTGERKLENVRISYIDYDLDNFQEKQVSDIEECIRFKNTSTVTWINIDGLHESGLIERLGSEFELHPLILEDILSTVQRPKFEEYEKNIFIVLRMLSYDEENHIIQSEQVSLVLGSNFVLSFQETVGDVFEPIRERIRNCKGRIRKAGPDYLMYALLDAIVDSYFSILEKLGEKIELLEKEVLSAPGNETAEQIHSLKREMIYLRRCIWPLRELISGLQRCESSLISESTNLYLRDTYDHTIQVIDTVESFRDITSGMIDIYLSSLSNRMNAVMKVLTIIATIFIPLTFIAGIYGMNFRYMPELEWRWGYPLILLLMLAVVLCMLIYFRRKKWI